MNEKENGATSAGICMECGSVMAGRRDKKFCSTRCKNIFHNREYGEFKKYRTSIMHKLSRNHEILESLLERGTRSALLEDISDLGFDGRYITGHRIGRGRHEECSCFDIRYYRSATKIFNIRLDDRGTTRALFRPSEDPSNHPE